jgi:hypothetical protein
MLTFVFYVHLFDKIRKNYKISSTYQLFSNLLFKRRVLKFYLIFYSNKNIDNNKRSRLIILSEQILIGSRSSDH